MKDSSELPIYEQDYYGWLMANAQLIRVGRFTDLDAQNLAEELESMGRSEKRELISRLAILMAHLLKWQHQPERRSNSWKYTIETQREDILDLMTDSPSLRHEIDAKTEKAYRKAKRLAANETGFQKDFFPDSCPYSFDQILDENYFPK